MPKTKISEYSATANSNTDVASINIDEGCAPSGINNAIRAIMGHLKDFQSGTSNDPFTIGSSGSLTLSYGTANGVAYLNGSKVLTTGSALVFDGSNLGLGVTPSAWSGGAGAKAIQMGGTSFSFLAANKTQYIYGNAYYDGSNNRYINSDYACSYGVNTSGAFQWNIAPSGTAGNAITFTQAMTLDASGNLLVGTTNSSASAGNGFKINPNGITTGVPQISIVGNNADNNNGTYSIYSASLGQYQFYVGYGGTVYARSTSITGLSDQREKENIRTLDIGLNEVLALQPRRFDWKDGSTLNVAGFVAQEVQQVLPDLIEEYKINDEETRLGLKMGDMIPTLVKAIQEQQVLITQLTARISALESA